MGLGIKFVLFLFSEAAVFWLMESNQQAQQVFDTNVCHFLQVKSVKWYNPTRYECLTRGTLESIIDKNQSSIIGIDRDTDSTLRNGLFMVGALWYWETRVRPFIRCFRQPSNRLSVNPGPRELKPCELLFDSVPSYSGIAVVASTATRRRNLPNQTSDFSPQGGHPSSRQKSRIKDPISFCFDTLAQTLRWFWT